MSTDPSLRHHGDAELGPGLVDLAVNVRAGTPPDWLHAVLLRSVDDDLARYPDCSVATAAVAARHARRPAEVLLTAGAAEAFVLLARAYAPRRAVVVHPQFTEPEAALRAAGHRVDRLVLDPADGFRLRPRAVPVDADLVVIGNPTNPTSVLHPAATLRALARPGRLVVVDEAFADTVPGEPESLAAQADVPGLVVVRSLTKTWGLAGLRIGYLLAAEDVVGRLLECQPLWAVSSPALAAAQACSSDAALAEARAAAERLVGERRHLVDGLLRAGLDVPGEPAASFVLARHPRAGVLREALRGWGYAVRRGDTFPGLGPEWVRIAVRDRATTDGFLAAVTAALTGLGRPDAVGSSAPGSAAPHSSSTLRAPARERVPAEGSRSHALVDTLAAIAPLDAAAVVAARERQDRLTKPRGSLGVLEDVSVQLSGLAGQCPPPLPAPVAVAVFAADHGVHAVGVSPWPQEVTAQMVGNFLAGGAVVNAFAAQVGATVHVVDVGVAAALDPHDALLLRKVRSGTGDFTTGPAMTRAEALAAVEVGIEVADALLDGGARLLVTGDMGIANTTASAALVAAFTGATVEAATGRGTGVDDETYARKIAAVRAGLALHRPDRADPLGVVAAVGGLEHAALAGYLLGASARRVPVVLDGVIACSAALVAAALAPHAPAAWIAGHLSAEPGARLALAALGLRPLVDLGLRLGEGTGAVLAVPLVQGAARALRDVATFDGAGVTDKGAGAPPVGGAPVHRLDGAGVDGTGEVG